jgi:putative ABC transport system ATP-binding protein
MADDAVVIEAQGLTKRYGEGDGVRAALDGVSISVKRGEFVAVVGPSGCGKSTLLGVLGCLDRGFEGSLDVFGQDVRSLGDVQLAQLRGQRIGFVFQAFHLLGHLSALENVLAPNLFQPDGPADSARARAESLLADFGLEGRGADMPATMSGGERQRLAIARALLLEPELLLCDEPTGNLDLKTGRTITSIFERLNAEGLTIVAVTHEEQLADAASRSVYLRAGRVVGSMQEATA